MPSSSPKQARTMRAAAHSPSFAKKVGIPQSVAREFVKEDKGRFAEGGQMKKIPPFMGRETKSEERKEMAVKRASPKMYAMAEKAEGVHGKSGKQKPTKYAAGGLSAGHKSADGVAKKGKTQGMQVKMRKGGSC